MWLKTYLSPFLAPFLQRSSLFSSLSEFTAIYFAIWILMNISYPFSSYFTQHSSFSSCACGQYITITFQYMHREKEREIEKGQQSLSLVFLEWRRKRFLWFLCCLFKMVKQWTHLITYITGTSEEWLEEIFYGPETNT